VLNAALRFVVIPCAFAFVFAAGLTPVQAEDDYRVGDGKIYFGSRDAFNKPAEVDIVSVYATIPEYIEIQTKGYTEANAEYWVLMSKCSSKFRAAVKKVAKRDSYDLVTALGVVTPTGDAPGVKDITIDVIAAIEN
jgi:hypothetical protein